MRKSSAVYIIAMSIFAAAILFISGCGGGDRCNVIPPGNKAVKISASYLHTCILMTSGGVKCWGDNSNGQLGDGTTVVKSTPVDVTGLTSGATAIAAGMENTCLLTSFGGAKCWGNNNFGQLGDGTIVDKLTPVDVGGLTSGVTSIAAGAGHTCALTTSGGVKCWGMNNIGQLGDGTTVDKSTPTDVSGLATGVNAVASGYWHTCAVTSSHGLKCWGNNSNGQLGDGTHANKSTPVDVIGLTSGVTAISAGSAHTCALTTSGGVKCWGDDGYGQLGDGTTLDKSTPVNVSELTSGVTAIAAGLLHTCALTTSGGVKCWGDNNNRELGDGTNGFATTPVSVVGF